MSQNSLAESPIGVSYICMYVFDSYIFHTVSQCHHDYHVGMMGFDVIDDGDDSDLISVDLEVISKIFDDLFPWRYVNQESFL